MNKIEDNIQEVTWLNEPLPAPAEVMVLDRRTWKRFVWKNICIYAATNVFFNSVVPYHSFEQPEAVSLFHGTYCIARFLLPLAFFIPLLVTIDTSNKIRTLFRKKVAGFSLPEQFRFKQFLWKQSLLNACLTFLLTLCVMAALQFAMPAGYIYNGFWVSGLMGIYAGVVALYFMHRTIGQLRAVAVIRVGG